MNSRGIANFQTTRFSGLSIPLDACLEKDGSMVFIDRAPGGGRRTILRLNLHGEPMNFSVQSATPRWSPSHLSLCADGSFLSLDTDEGILAKHDAVTGALLWQRNIAGDESDQLFLGRPWEGPDGRIFIPGGELHAVLVYDAEGIQIGRFGEFGTGPGKMIFPTAVGFGPGGSIVVLDRMRHKLLVHDSEWNLLAEFGSFGVGFGQFYHPSDLAVTDDGRVFVAQGFEGRVQVFQLAVHSQP